MDFNKIIALLISLIPTILLFSYIFYTGRKTKTPTYMLVLSLLGGIIAIYLSRELEIKYVDLYNGYLDTNFDNFLYNMYSMLQVSGIEEIIKFIIVFSIVYFNQKYNDPYDAVLCSTLTAVSFGLLENIVYMIGVSNIVNSTTIIITRVFTTLPIHTVCGIVMGYYFSIFQFSKKKKIMLLIKSLIMPILIHTIYNALFINLNLIYNLYGDNIAFLGLIGSGIFICLVYLIAIILVKEAVTLNKIFINNEKYPNNFKHLMNKKEYRRN